MTDSQIITIAGIYKNDIVNGTYKLNLSDEQISTLSANSCIAVVGCMEYDGPYSDTLRLFKSKSLAEEYIVKLLHEGISKLSYDGSYHYVEVQIQEIVIAGQ